MYINWYRLAKIQQEAGIKEFIPAALLMALIAVMGGSGIMNAVEKYKVNQQDIENALQNPELMNELQQQYQQEPIEPQVPEITAPNNIDQIRQEIDLTDSKEWTGIVVHHSDSPAWTTVDNIDSWHREQGYDRGIGYNFVIYPDGSVHKGRDLSISGAHALSGKPYSRNSSHIGICLIGEQEFTATQLNSLGRLIHELAGQFNIQSVERHHEECPGKGVNVEVLNENIQEMNKQKQNNFPQNI